MNAAACASSSVNPRNPTNPDSYTGDEIQYDPARRLSLNGELGAHISAIMLEGDTLEHLAHGDGTNVLGPAAAPPTPHSPQPTCAPSRCWTGRQWSMFPSPPPPRFPCWPCPAWQPAAVADCSGVSIG